MPLGADLLSKFRKDKSKDETTRQSDVRFAILIPPCFVAWTHRLDMMLCFVKFKFLLVVVLHLHGYVFAQLFFGYTHPCMPFLLYS